jgi:hypothetical protein
VPIQSADSKVTNEEDNTHPNPNSAIVFSFLFQFDSTNKIGKVITLHFHAHVCESCRHWIIISAATSEGTEYLNFGTGLLLQEDTERFSQRKCPYESVINITMETRAQMPNGCPESEFIRLTTTRMWVTSACTHPFIHKTVPSYKSTHGYVSGREGTARSISLTQLSRHLLS